MWRKLAQNWVLPFVDPRRIASVIRLPGFFIAWMRYRRMAGGGNARLADLWPSLMDRVSHTPFDPHYFYQAAWLARHLAKEHPPLHVDVASQIGMVAVLAAYAPVVFVDYRPLQVHQSGLLPIAGDITRLPFADGSVASLSCLHVIEHIGLGRYGDPIDPSGHRAGLRELERVLAPGGRLYLSTPVGRERVCFNAHRVFATRTILDALPGLQVVRFGLVDDQGRYADECTFSRADDLSYGCGLFVMTKI
jgi:SAM-dependent methyltransferase